MAIDVLLIVFKLLLFVLLVYKLTQLIYSHVIPLLKEEVDIEHKQHTELFEREKLLISTQLRLENQMNSQKKTFALLDKNIQIWHACLLAQKEENERLARSTSTQLEIKRKIQQEHLALAKDSLTVIPASCEKATIELRKQFEEEQQGKKQLRAFITKLVSKTS